MGRDARDGAARQALEALLHSRLDGVGKAGTNGRSGGASAEPAEDPPKLSQSPASQSTDWRRRHGLAARAMVAVAMAVAMR